MSDLTNGNKIGSDQIKSDIGTLLSNRSQKMKNLNKEQQQFLKLMNFLHFRVCRKMIWPLENLQSKTTFLLCISYCELSSLL